MKRKYLENGFGMSVLGMGTWGTGGRQQRDEGCDDDQLIRVIRHGLDLGYDRIDLAEYYAAGYGEELVGKALRGVDRSSVFLTSKVWKTHLRGAAVKAACEGSLRRLGTDHLDLYLIHQVSDEVPLEETLEALCELVDSGKVRHLGVSNFGVERLRRACALSRHPLVVNQVHYNLRVRECEASGLLDWCQAHDVLLEAWRPLRDVTSTPLTEELCGKYGCTLPQLALTYVLHQPKVVTLTAMRSAKHMPENLGALDLELSPGDWERLHQGYPGQVYVSPAVPLR